MALRARARAGPAKWSNRSIPSSDRLQRLRPPRVETDAGVAAARHSGAVDSWNFMWPWRIEESAEASKGSERIFAYSGKSGRPAARLRAAGRPVDLTP